MKTSSKMLFVLMLITSTIMVLSSSTWINMWIGLEINLMSFIPLMSTPKNPFLTQSSMMYFLVQSMASMLFIIFILTNKYIFINLNKSFLKSMIMSTMMMKMGMPPFHMWFPEVMKKLNWMMCFTLMTWQKIAPMYIMSMIIEMNYLISSIICLSSMIGAVGGMNQTSTKKIMAYSSINHMSWMVACAATFKKSWMLYMLLYTMLMAMMSLLMYIHNINFLNQMNIFFTKNMEKIIIITMMLSLGGLPPFIGFIPKWMTIQYMISSKEFWMMIIMVMSSLITMAYYLRITSSMNMILSHSQKWLSILTTSKNTSNYILIINLTLPLFIFFMNFF